MYSLGTLPFWLHGIVEIFAAVNFAVNPAQQAHLPPGSTAAEAVIRQYGVLLASSSLIAVIFATRRIDSTSRGVAAALALYHTAPWSRAVGTILHGDVGFGGGLGGPVVHMAVHSICLAALLSLAYLS